MAELARWQWDDFGVWRDFAEQYQAEMEAAFQSRARSRIDVEIPPFGTFRMDIINMTQTTLKGRNHGYERSIRRQARHIEIGYFLKGHEGEVFASDSALDQIDDVAVLEQIIRVISRIIEEPEEFGHRSLNLNSDEYRDLLGASDDAVDFLSERGFEEIDEADTTFLIFMQEEVGDLAGARSEVEARLGRVRRGATRPRLPPSRPTPSSSSTAPPPVGDGEAPYFEVGIEGGWTRYSVEASRAIAEGLAGGKPEVRIEVNGRPYRIDLLSMRQISMVGMQRPVRPVMSRGLSDEWEEFGDETSEDDEADEDTSMEDAEESAASADFTNPDLTTGADGSTEAPESELQPRGNKRKASNPAKGGGKGKGGDADGGYGAMSSARSDCDDAAAAATATEAKAMRSAASEEDRWRPTLEECLSARGANAEVPAETAHSGALELQFLVEGGEVSTVVLPSGSLVEFLEEAKRLSGFRLPAVDLKDADTGQPCLQGLAAEPGVQGLRQAMYVRKGECFVVSDGEDAFVEKLQSGLLRLQDLACVAPLLDWEKPELPKLVLGRLRSLLEGSGAAWCRAAGCNAQDELLYGRALLRFLHGDKSMEHRLELCRQLLPTEKKHSKMHLVVKRDEFLKTALLGLSGLSEQQLRAPLMIQFEGEIAEDHGGPRRDFFAGLGGRLVSDMPALWRRLPLGAIAPRADAATDMSSQDARQGLPEVVTAYRCCGRASALAFKYGDILGEDIAAFFLHQVTLKDAVGLEELQRQLSDAVGSDDVRCSSHFLDKPVAEIGLQEQTLTRVISDTEIEVELTPGGRDRLVTDQNKTEWLELHLRHKLYGSVRKAADAFRQGLLDVFGGTLRTCPLLVLLSPGELARMWAGSSIGDEDVRRWKTITNVSPEVQQQAQWLWEVLEEGDEDLRAGVLKFTTGARRLPHTGLQLFEVQPADGNDDALPRAMTCGNMLQLPRYSSKKVLAERLAKATELCAGFQIL
eukprot:TRINITY_DN11054_c0_g1_i2.p1 TRINITY_DN11054_c0_g1~~TRINITY_DN11054_c0_g1_i2.p1  ORF type:complete len:980 (-),score=254.33 TRINITY_DN11054_c0_g1_i2:520-3459(-)